MTSTGVGVTVVETLPSLHVYVEVKGMVVVKVRGPPNRIDEDEDKDDEDDAVDEDGDEDGGGEARNVEDGPKAGAPVLLEFAVLSKDCTGEGVPIVCPGGEEALNVEKVGPDDDALLIVCCTGRDRVLNVLPRPVGGLVPVKAPLETVEVAITVTAPPTGGVTLAGLPTTEDTP